MPQVPNEELSHQLTDAQLFAITEDILTPSGLTLKSPRQISKTKYEPPSPETDINSETTSNNVTIVRGMFTKNQSNSSIEEQKTK